MKKCIYLIVFISFCFTSCQEKDSPEPFTGPAGQTVCMYLPWAEDLLDYFHTNVSDFERAISRGILKKERVVVFLSTSATEAVLFELKYKKGMCVREVIRYYENPPFTTTQGITAILRDVIGYAPARRYGMIIGCHGMGWIPVQQTASRTQVEKEYWQYEGKLKTRWFGGTTSRFQTDITTLAEGISGAGIKMEYIVFDDCYMSSVEAAYNLRHVTDYLIGCPTEIMAYGMPYATMAEHLIGEVDYEGIVNAFHAFYSTYTVMPCGTIGVTVCAELEPLAAVMKTINSLYTLDRSLLGHIQRMDGYSPTRFFDLCDYVRHLCPDPTLFEPFETQLERTVPSGYRKHTTHFYTMSRGRIYINTFSGITVSDPSTSSSASSKTETSWYRATH
ncbi:MAG: clostripain-related cysteine peptidase [Bacteroides sp.]|nr:clostripain-related cysteine peptidase [Bacteroides sp.]